MNIARVPNVVVLPSNAKKYGKGPNDALFPKSRKEPRSKLVSGKYNVGVVD